MRAPQKGCFIGSHPTTPSPYWAPATDGSYGSGRPSRDRWHSVMLGIGSTIRQVRRDSWWTWSCRTSSGQVHRSVSRRAWEPAPAGGRREAMTSRLRLALHLDWRRSLVSWFALPVAVIAALLIGAGMLLALGANPLTGYRALLEGAFGSVDSLIHTAIKAVPIVLVGVGICIALRANVLNIGGEGQLVMGGLSSTATALALPDLPKPLLVPLVLLAGAVGGAIWGAIPGSLKAYFTVNEILSTIMLNIVAVQIMNYLLSGPLVDKSFSGFSLIPQTKRLSPHADLPVLVGGTHLHAGVIV